MLTVKSGGVRKSGETLPKIGSLPQRVKPDSASHHMHEPQAPSLY